MYLKVSYWPMFERNKRNKINKVHFAPTKKKINYE